MRNRRFAVIAIALVLLTLAVRKPIADVRIIRDSAGDAPVKIQAAIDVGVVAFSVLWSTSKRLSAR